MIPRVNQKNNLLKIDILFEEEKPNYQEEDIILERKTNDPEILKKILDIEKSIIKRAKKIGVI